MEWKDGKTRCSWANPKNERYLKYHDEEWGIPVHDDHRLFEMLVLEGFQAGLSWECVLNKREAFRRAFDNFDLEKVMAYDGEKLEALYSDPEIIRNRLKIRAAVTNAAVFRDIQTEYGSFSEYLWNWTGGKTVRETGKTSSPLSDAISADLKKRGMKFVGTTIIYAYLQACGVIWSHEKGCYLEKQFPEGTKSVGGKGGKDRMRIRLVKLSDRYRAQMEDMMDEWTKSGEKIIPAAIVRCDYRQWEEYLDSLEVKDGSPELVPDSTFFCLDEERNIFVGAVNIRHWLNEGLLKTGGHVGDGVRPSERRKGYATAMIGLALEECRKLGISRVLMVCDRDNTGSARSIKNNGGVLENEITLDGTVKQRYWIAIDGEM